MPATAPGSPAATITAHLDNDTGSSSTDGITSDPTLTGTGAANAVVHFSVDGSAIVPTATADASGAWNFTPTGLVNGSHTVVASETDAAGNTGSASLTFTLDTTAPAITARLANDTGSSSTDKITSNPALTGAGAANAVVHFTVDGSTIAGTATADASGAWNFTPTGLVNGSHTVVASETDAAGNTGSASLTFTLDTTAPAITARLANDTGSSSTDRITSNPDLTGTANAATATTTADASGGNGGTTVIDPLIVSSDQTAGNATISNGAQLELAPGTSENVLFAGGTGMLKLNDSQHFDGQISGFGGRDTLDLADIGFSSHLTLGYGANNDNSGGTLTVNGGMHVANLALLGSYMASSFVASSDGHGGTFIDQSQESSNVLSPLAQPRA